MAFIGRIFERAFAVPRCRRHGMGLRSAFFSVQRQVSPASGPSGVVKARVLGKF